MSRCSVGRKLGAAPGQGLDKLPLTGYPFYEPFFKSPKDGDFMYPIGDYVRALTSGTMGKHKIYLLPKTGIKENIMRTGPSLFMISTFDGEKPTLEADDVIYTNTPGGLYFTGHVKAASGGKGPGFGVSVPPDADNLTFQQKVDYFVDHNKEIDIAYMTVTTLLDQVYPHIGEPLRLKAFFTQDISAAPLRERIKKVTGGYPRTVFGSTESMMSNLPSLEHPGGFLFDWRVIYPEFIPEEEPEVSALAKRDLGKHLRIITGHEVRHVEQAPGGGVRVTAVNRVTGDYVELSSEKLMLASGRASNTDILHPERGGVETDESGWIKVDEYLETSQRNIWAIGDAHGRQMFKHVANYDAYVAYSNLREKMVKTDYSAVPHAVFTYMEIASVGMKEKEAVSRYGAGNVLVGFEQYENTVKGEAMGVSDYFAKVIVEKETMRILGAHIIGPMASVLIQEVINLMYVEGRSAEPLIDAIHIHPGLSELVLGAFNSLMSPEEYHRELENLNLLSS